MANIKTQSDDTKLIMNPDNNDGPVFSKMGAMQVKVPYGKDNSLYAGSPRDEQIADSRFGGGTDNLSHTLSGSDANQGD